MLSVAEAQGRILQLARPTQPHVVSLAAADPKSVLAEDVVSDLDMPPYAKSMMDGFAVRAADLASGQATLTVIEEVTAGRVPQLPVGPGQATRIMTGAPLPSGADAVIPVEQTRQLDGRAVQIDDRPPRPGKNVLPQGREMRRGEVVLATGTPLRPAVVGLLATMGRAAVRVFPAPTVAIVPTGDEVVDVSETPGPGQIRNSNGPMLTAQAARAGGQPRYLGIARDRADSLRSLIAEGLRSSILVLSGGVSAGTLDLVPGVLQELGVEAHFHKVDMKPGKPVFFGTRAAGPAPPCLVFGLPGNPVSSLVCFELFVRPAIRRLLGHAEPGPRLVPMPLAEDFTYATDRPTYHPARREIGPDGWRVRPIPWFGSSDLRALVGADVFVLFPTGDRQHRAGTLYPVLLTEE